jgi:phosphoserine phosphatase RsbU/P
MVDPVPTPRTGAVATSIVTLPRQLVVAVLLLTFLPFLLNRLGLDFSAVKLPVSPAEESDRSAVNENRRSEEPIVGEHVHTLLEWSAVCVAVFTAMLAFANYRITRDVTTPIIGTALFASGMLDAFHTLAADGLLTTAVHGEQFIPFTWMISRGVNAVFIVFGVFPFLWNNWAAIDRARRKGMAFILLVGLLFALMAYATIHICLVIPSLPKTVYPPPAVVHRPWDLIPLVLYLIAGGIILPRFHRLHPSLFSYGLLLSMVPNVVAQLYASFGSPVLYDNSFNIADYLKIIAYLVPLVGLIFDYARVYRTALAHHTTETKMRVARDVLQGLLPQSTPQIPGFDVAAVSIPADMVGGDYFDYVPMSNGCLGIVVADVSGHEIGASVLLSQTRAYLRALAYCHSDMSEIMTQLNRFLVADVGHRWFVELFLVRIDPTRGSFSYAGAGHEGYLLNTSGEVTKLQTTTTPLGIVDQEMVPCGVETDFRPNEILLVFTDGLVEAVSADGEQFGAGRATRIVTAARDKSAREIVAGLMDAVRAFRQSSTSTDDITVAVIKRNGRSGLA